MQDIVNGSCCTTLTLDSSYCSRRMVDDDMGKLTGIKQFPPGIGNISGFI
jgi:hypothetical protein